MSLENAKLQEWLQGLLTCGVDSEGQVDQAIKSDINIRMLTDLAPTIIGTRTPDGELTYINSYWFWFTGCEDTAPEDIDWQDYIHPDDLANLLRINEDGFGTGLDFSFEFRLRRRDGEYRWFQAICRPVMDRLNQHVSQWLTVSTPIQDLKDAQEEARRAREDMEHKVLERTRDLEEANERLLQEIEERQKTQDALRQAQKMESVGQLTGGIAHDFNNMLAVIMGNLELMKMSLANLGNNPTVQRIDRNVTMALEGALKAEKLTAQLLAFSRKARLHPERLNVNEVILGVREMVERAVGSSIVCEIDLEDDIWLCLSDKTQLESAIINLSINARDAMGRSGHLCIFSRNKTIGDQRFVSVSVKDDGAGMDAETLAKAFEPFFTTKDVGKGSGLGISMVHGFCQQSNGKVFIESEVGKGTTVEMIFPYTAGAAIAETKADEDFNYDMNKRSVLVVEDEPGVRELACQLLTDLGYNVVSAEDGKSAIEILKDDSIPLDLLFTDVVMPGGVDGFSVAKVAAFERPSMPVIFTTGHAEVALRELKKDLSQKIKVIGKPYRIADLSSMIAAELNPR